MNCTDINHELYNIIIKSHLYKKSILRLYIINNFEYMDRSNIYEIIEMFSINKCKINLEKLKTVQENITFNDQSYILINKIKFNELLKTQNYKILYNTIILVLENIKKIKLYNCNNLNNCKNCKNYKKYDIKKNQYEIDKLKKEIENLQKIKIELSDLKLTINYLNGKMNYICNTILNDNISIINNTSLDNDNSVLTYNIRFPNLNTTVLL